MEQDQIKIKINLAAVKSAIQNAGSIEGATFEVPIIGVEDIRPKMKIWGVVANPISDKATPSEKPNTLRYYAVQQATVNEFSLVAKEGYCVVNGTIDIPEGSGKLKGLEGMWMESEHEAKTLAGLFTKNQLEEAQRLEEQAHEAVAFLEKQIEDNRF